MTPDFAPPAVAGRDSRDIDEVSRGSKVGMPGEKLGAAGGGEVDREQIFDVHADRPVVAAADRAIHRLGFEVHPPRARIELQGDFRVGIEELAYPRRDPVDRRRRSRHDQLVGPRIAPRLGGRGGARFLRFALRVAHEVAEFPGELRPRRFIAEQHVIGAIELDEPGALNPLGDLPARGERRIAVLRGMAHQSLGPHLR
jgi:hypothetical protein